MQGGDEQSDRHQMALQELTRLISRSDRPFEETVSDVLELGCQYLDLSIGFLSTIAPEDDRFTVEYARGEHPQIQRGSTAPFSETYCRCVFDRDGLLAVDDAAAEGWADDPAYERFALACYLGGTVTVEDERYGTLCFADTDRRERSFSEAERTFVELVVGWVGEQIEHRERSDALQAEQRFVDEVFDTLDDTIFVLDTDGRLVRWNDEVTAITGYDDETLAGMDVRRLFEERTRETVESKLAAVVETGTATMEAELLRADGGHVPMEFRASLLTAADGTVTGICGVGRDVSDRRAREQRLREYERAFENVRGLVYVLDSEGTMTLVSPGLADRLGTERGNLVGRHVGEIVADPAVATEQTQPDEDTLAETQLLATDGRTIPVRVDVTPLDGAGGVVGTIRDVSELAAARRELDDERSRFQYLFDTIPDPVNEVAFEDGEPILRAVNEAFEDVFGYPGGEVVGRSANDIIVPPEADREARAVDERVLRQGTATVEIRREAADGIRDFLFRGIPYSEDGEHVEAFGIYTDITDQKRRERYLKILARIVRHNLRNKLDVILGNARWLTTIDDDRIEARAAMIVDAATELADLSDTAQQIERVIERNVTATSTVDATTILDAAVTTARDRWPDANIELKAPDTLPVQADERLQVAIDELVENAIEHYVPPAQSRPDGDETPPTEPTVRLTANPARSDGWVTIAVADDGPGIPETERWVLTGESEITQLNHSRGLGLWLAKWIVESFGGDIDITTSDNGSVVTVYLKQVPE